MSGPARAWIAAHIKARSVQRRARRLASSGCGIDVIYPQENKKIFVEMEMRRAIISEFTMGMFPGPQEFSDSQSRHRGDVAGCDGRRGRAYFVPPITARLAMSLARIS